MYGSIIQDWTKVDITDQACRAKVFGALNNFMAKATQNPDLKAALRGDVQHLGQPGDFPTSVLEILEKYRIDTAYDEGWKLVFDVRDFTGSNRNGFDILDVEDGLTFAEVELGDHADVYKMSGSKVTVNFAMYGGGLQWHRTLFDDKEYWTLEDNAYAFRNKSGAHIAQVHYDLIDAVGAGQNIAWQAPQPAGVPNTNETYTANRDMQTLNLAAQTILLAIEGKGYGVTASNAQFIVLCPIQLKGRIRRALGVMLQAMSSSEGLADYSFTVVPTTMLASSTEYYVILPKKKLKSGNRMNLAIFDQFSPTSYSDLAVGWTRFGAAIGDTDQIHRCSTA